MPFMEWTEDFSIGIPAIDEEHKVLVKLLNDLYDAVESGQGHQRLEQTLDGLLRYISYHFAHEEGLQQQAHYFAYEAHKKEHDKLQAQVLKIHEDFNASDTETLSMDVVAFLKSWLYTHIMNTDKKFGAFVTSGQGMPEGWHH